MTHTSAPPEAANLAVDLDAELTYHLGEPESWAILRTTIRPEMIEDEDACSIFKYQAWHYAQYGKGGHTKHLPIGSGRS